MGFARYWWSILIIYTVSGQLLASGLTLHIWTADKATDLVSSDELKELLEEHRQAYRNGSIFPDTGYAIGHAYGEYSHWHGFLNSYYAVIRERCPELNDKKCRTAFAHFLGSLAHSLGDVNFDRHFVHQASQLDYDGDMGKSQELLDPGCDFLAIIDHKRGFKLPIYKLPIDFLLAAYTYGQQVQPSKADLEKGNHIQNLAAFGEPFASPFVYLYYKAKMPWASKNYLTARGGVDDTAQRIALAWDLVWDHFSSGSPDTLFHSQGGWPHVDFFVAGYSMEDFLL